MGHTDAGHRRGLVDIAGNCKVKAIGGSCCEKARNNKQTSTVLNNETADAQTDALTRTSVEPRTLLDVDAAGWRNRKGLFGLEVTVGPGVGVNHAHSQCPVRQVVDKVDGVDCPRRTSADWNPL